MALVWLLSEFSLSAATTGDWTFSAGFSTESINELISRKCNFWIGLTMLLFSVFNYTVRIKPFLAGNTSATNPITHFNLGTLSSLIKTRLLFFISHFCSNPFTTGGKFTMYDLLQIFQNLFNNLFLRISLSDNSDWVTLHSSKFTSTFEKLLLPMRKCDGVIISASFDSLPKYVRGLEFTHDSK